MHFSDVLAMPCDVILNMLSTLQLHALEKLASRVYFQETGLATLRVKVVGGTGLQKNITMYLNETGESLKNKIISEMNFIATTRFYLIK